MRLIYPNMGVLGSFYETYILVTSNAMTPPHKTILLLLLTLIGCNQNRNFPEVKDLANYKQTDFLPTLEHSIKKNRNAVYAASLLYAWNEIRKTINQPLTINKTSFDLFLLNNSESFKQTLKDGEYSTSVTIEGDLIRAKANFNKSLPFKLKLSSFSNELIFNKTKVASFGKLNGYDEKISGIISILYYKDDDNFIIKLTPKDRNHEIILFKSPKSFKTMAEIVAEIKSKTKIGVSERKSDKTSWRYYIEDCDEVVIPKFEFNIEHNYITMKGKSVGTAKQDYLIETAYQRTAFILDESGAKVESEAVFDVTEEAEDIPHPKKMRFDKPFFLMLKRTDSINPYFGLWTANSELMLRK